MKQFDDPLSEAVKRCEGEPVQFIGAIQNHGVLFAVDDCSLVRVASDNLQDLLGISAAQALNQPAATILGPEAWASVVALTINDQQRDPQPFVLRLNRGGSRVDHQAQAHRSDGLLVIEVEVNFQVPEFSRSIDFDSTDRLLNALLADTANIESYTAVVADQVQRLTGYDRVMVYQFDHQWNGKIIAESRKEGIASFLGNHFPASDIPPPARELYTRNLVRILVDRDAPTLPLIQTPDFSPSRSLDLSFSLLRGMSPVHLEYLRNLGVRASLTVSLLQNGRLWGLIACHHEQPWQLSFKLRQTMELVARTVALRLTAIAFDDSNRYYARVRDILPRLVSRVQDAPGKSVFEPELQYEVLDLVHATGAVSVIGEAHVRIGATPPPEQFLPLLDWVRLRLATDSILATHALSGEYAPAAGFSDIASGLLAIRLDDSREQFLLWFRDEVVRSIPWAGEAAKQLMEDEYGPKLEPRRSFALWVQTQRGESLPWSALEVDAARLLSITLEEVFAHQQLHLAAESNRLAASVYESSSEGMLVVDANNLIIAVNPAFTKLTGYSPEETIGQTPRILKSDKHDRAFYESMWQSINADGYWCGEIWNRRKSGEIYPEWLTINTILDDNGAVHRRIGLFTDIAERIRAEEQIRQHAFFDPLTHLPNRRLFYDRLNQEIRKTHRQEEHTALLFIDLDRFKDVNDTLGHTKGDQLLLQAAARIGACLRATDTLAHPGGDEFAVLLDTTNDLASVEEIAQSIIRTLTDPYSLDDEQIVISASLGIAFFPMDADNTEDLLKNAEQAMYEAKRSGRGRHSYFASYMQEAAQVRMRLLHDLRGALGENQFAVYYQPIVDLATGSIRKAEALIRWHHPDHGMISPAAFIPLAEETGAIIDIGNWVFREAAGQVARWRLAYHDTFQISVNKSPVQFSSSADSNAEWFAYLEHLGLPGQSIVVEITEGLLMGANAGVNGKLLGFRDAGIEVSLDDFGTGYSSLSYLNKFDIDYLKIDQSFVRDMGPDSSNLALCEAIIVMAHKLGMKVIAEGVETIAQRDLLAAAGCDYGQGFLFSRPVPPAEFEKLMN